MNENSIFLANEAATEEFGKILAKLTDCKGLISLSGELGAGKTCLCRGLIQASGHQGAVKSPTYTIVEPYELEHKRIMHFDLYRLADPEELEYLGFRDYLNDTTLCLIEWPEKGSNFLPKMDMYIDIQFSESGRKLRWSAGTDYGSKLSESIKLHYQDSLLST